MQLINRHQDQFIQMMNEEAAEGQAEGGGGGGAQGDELARNLLGDQSGMGQGQYINVTPQEKEAIDRVSIPQHRHNSGSYLVQVNTGNTSLVYC